jgi:hypothetical protein
MSSRGFLGAGDLFVRTYNPTTAAFDQWTGPFEASKFEIKPNSDLKEMVSRGRSTYGQVIESVPLPKPADLSVTFSEVNKDSISMALFGTASTLAQGSGTVTDEVVVAAQGKWVKLAFGNIATAGFVVSHTSGTPNYVLNTDYEVNYRLGMLRILAGGAIADAASLKVDYTYNAIAGTKVAGGTQTQVRAQFKLDGVNFADQLPVIVDVWEAVLTPDSAFDFLQNDFAEIALKGRLKTPAGKAEPFTVELRDAA